MGKFISNLDSFMAGLRKEKYEVDRLFSHTVAHTVILLHEEITARTPVNTGLTLNNYVWTVGQPFTQTLAPVEIGSPYGTNRMALGEEPRRGPNMVGPNESLKALDFSYPFQKYILTNNSPAVAGLEFGQLPMGDQYTPRSPNGMFLISLTYVHALLEAGHI